MWFLIVLLFGVSPRLVMLIMWLTSGYLGKAFTGGIFWPVVGFLFLPWTTLWCAYVYNNGGFVQWWHTAVAIICVLVDMGSDGNAAARRQVSADNS